MKKLLLFLLVIPLLMVSGYADTERIFGNGMAEVSVASSEKIAVFSPGTTKVYYKVGSPNIPGAWYFAATVTGREYLSSAVTSATAFRIEPDAGGAWYSTDSTPDVQIPGAGVLMKSQRSPTADTTADTLTVEELMGGIITYTSSAGADGDLTLPLGTSMDASSDAGVFGVNQSFDWTVINLSTAAADTCTVTANTGHSVVGVGIVQSAHATTGGLYGNAATFRTRKTAASTFVTYRIH